MEAANGTKSAVATEETRPVHKPKPRGRYTCCVPGCYSNSKKDMTFSFHKIPKDEPYRTKWINAIKRKEFTPGEHHRMCSVHFRNGKKIGTTDVPVLFPLLPTPSFRKPPTARQAPAKKHKASSQLIATTSYSSSTSTLADSDTTETLTSESIIQKLQQEIADLKAEKSSLLMNYLLFCTDFVAIH
ncbi:THAP domain-containing protein 11-like [Dysidea avara]|uniref:THAP domain-containing protein 11-like n=1 Tax=Dysidea avara TaxID=196820 RepID=UPI003330720F